MAEAQKKVIVRPFEGDPVSGYLPAGGFVGSGNVTLMDIGGRPISFILSDIKLIAYVRDFNAGDLTEPERLGRRTFPARPRSEGLWLRMTFRDGTVLEGLTDANITFIDKIATDDGIAFSPPDARSNTQRIYVPRAALTEFEIVGVISTTKRKPAPAREPQPGLFGES